MRLPRAWLLPVLVAVAACSAAQSARAPSTADATAVERAVTDEFFRAISAFDYEALRRTVTADFELVEDTVRLSTEEFIEFLRPYEGSSFSYRFGDFNTRIRGPVAWTTYRNEAVLQMRDRRVDVLWLETAVLEQADGKWRIARLQSTPVRPR